VDCNVAQYQEYTAEDSQTDSIVPQCQIVEAKARQNGGAGHFDIKAVLVIHKTERLDFVDYQAFETEVENRQLHDRQRMFFPNCHSEESTYQL
jgi:hypothetical protein